MVVDGLKPRGFCRHSPSDRRRRNRASHRVGDAHGNDKRPMLVRIPLAMLSLPMEHPPAHEYASAMLTKVDQDRTVRIDWDFGNEGIHGQGHVVCGNPLLGYGEIRCGVGLHWPCPFPASNRRTASAFS